MNNLRIIRVHTGENWSKLWDAKNQNTGSWKRDLWGEETVFCILGANSGALRTRILYPGNTNSGALRTSILDPGNANSGALRIIIGSSGALRITRILGL